MIEKPYVPQQALGPAGDALFWGLRDFHKIRLGSETSWAWSSLHMK